MFHKTFFRQPCFDLLDFFLPEYLHIPTFHSICGFGCRGIGKPRTHVNILKEWYNVCACSDLFNSYLNKREIFKDFKIYRFAKEIHTSNRLEFSYASMQYYVQVYLLKEFKHIIPADQSF